VPFDGADGRERLDAVPVHPYKKMLMRRLIPWTCALAWVALATGPLLAGQVVWFTDGRQLEVASLERAGEMFALELPGGGRISVPGERIARWGDLPQRSAAPQRVPSEAPWRAMAGEFADVIGAAAERHAVDPALLTAVARAESALDPRAVSPKGAQGLLQLMPATAERFGVRDAFDVAENVDAGARYLSWLLERYGRTDLALAGYNAGEGRVDAYRGVPPYRETRDYVRRVLADADRLGSGPP